jgi:hypothetical protein
MTTSKSMPVDRDAGPSACAGPGIRTSDII